ncbi:uncharacterized protein LOC113751872 [Coffea eugenioides]|uniref:uncharacterized protein LOC113751872 n=1 Tax=Coffea eugenioides TaxID=49369 RepID=UPI000F60A85F|nr:uncharacterized protein LOC113751872 [Coffea eugenioides]
MKENKCYLSRHQGYRAKKISRELAQGSDVDQYNKLPKYINEILRSNPDSIVVIKVADDYYGTFLKGAVGGVLLTAVEIDPNNGLYPISYSRETKDSWIWFLTLLKKDLKIEKDYEWTIMSDKQKGIIQACETVFSGADHKFCVKHMHNNMAIAGFKGEIGLTGIPCAHAISALWIAMKDPKQYVDDGYSVKTYLKCYGPYILQVNGENEWEDIDLQAPLPPTYGRALGRPKKQRRKSADEIQQTKEQCKKTCKLRQEASAAASQMSEQGQETQANWDMSLSQLDDMMVDNHVRGNTLNAKTTTTSRKFVGNGIK